MLGRERTDAGRGSRKMTNVWEEEPGSALSQNLAL